MTQEDKQLLLQDICARLPYGVIGAVEHYDEVDNSSADLLGIVQGFDNVRGAIKFEYLQEYSEDAGAYNWFYFAMFKPYLRPLSNMTDEEKKEFIDAVTWEANGKFHIDECEDISFYQEKYDWLNANHFDYRGLIDKGLAIAVTADNNPYTN